MQTEKRMWQILCFSLRNRIVLLAKQSDTVLFDRVRHFTFSRQVTFEVYFRGRTLSWFRSQGRFRRPQTFSVRLSVGISSRWQHVIANPLLSNYTSVIPKGKIHNLSCRKQKVMFLLQSVCRKQIYVNSSPGKNSTFSAMPEIIPGLSEGTRSRKKQGSESVCLVARLALSLCHLRKVSRQFN